MRGLAVRSITALPGPAVKTFVPNIFASGWLRIAYASSTVGDLPAQSLPVGLCVAFPPSAGGSARFPQTNVARVSLPLARAAFLLSPARALVPSLLHSSFLLLSCSLICLPSPWNPWCLLPASASLFEFSATFLNSCAFFQSLFAVRKSTAFSDATVGS